jgi:hypothetical protein
LDQLGELREQHLMIKLVEVLDFLEKAGLILKRGDQYLPGTTQLHLPKEMHSDRAGEGLNYSSVSSVSASDAQKIKAILTQAIGDAIQVVKASPEEELIGINVDLFRVDEG